MWIIKIPCSIIKIQTLNLIIKGLLKLELGYKLWYSYSSYDSICLYFHPVVNEVDIYEYYNIR